MSYLAKTALALGNRYRRGASRHRRLINSSSSSSGAGNISLPLIVSLPMSVQPLFPARSSTDAQWRNRRHIATIGISRSSTSSLPPLAEQKRIVGILDEAFDGIATAKANAEKNLQNARALFETHL